MNHPITPPPELIGQWLEEFFGPETMPGMAPGEVSLHIATQAARWGADQELEACCWWLQDPDLNVDTYKLRAYRRPKPPSLAEQGCDALDAYIYGNPDYKDKERTYNTIRAALERLQELEQSND